MAAKLTDFGATDVDLADFFRVSIATIQEWRTAHPEFAVSRKLGKDAADERVVNSLYHRAIGYSFDTVKIFPPKSEGGAPVIVPYREHVAPDTTAAIFWLKNRRPEDWRDVRNLNVNHDFAGMETAAQVLDVVRAKLGEAIAGTLATLIENDEPQLLELQAEPASDDGEESQS